jgi:hypothetical protein
MLRFGFDLLKRPMCVSIRSAYVRNSMLPVGTDVPKWRVHGLPIGTTCLWARLLWTKFGLLSFERRANLRSGELGLLPEPLLVLSLNRIVLSGRVLQRRRLPRLDPHEPLS